VQEEGDGLVLAQPQEIRARLAQGLEEEAFDGVVVWFSHASSRGA